MLVTPPPHTFWLPPQAASALKQKQMYVVLEGRNSIRQHTKKGPEKDRQREKGTRERPAETKDTRDGEEEEEERRKKRKKRGRERKKTKKKKKMRKKRNRE